MSLLLPASPRWIPVALAATVVIAGIGAWFLFGRDAAIYTLQGGTTLALILGLTHLRETGPIILEQDTLKWKNGKVHRKDVQVLRVGYTNWSNIAFYGTLWLKPMIPRFVDPDRHLPLALYVDTGDDERRILLINYPTPKARAAIKTLEAEGWPVTLELERKEREEEE